MSLLAALGPTDKIPQSLLGLRVPHAVTEPETNPPGTFPFLILPLLKKLRAPAATAVPRKELFPSPQLSPKRIAGKNVYRAKTLTLWENPFFREVSAAGTAPHTSYLAHVALAFMLTSADWGFPEETAASCHKGEEISLNDRKALQLTDLWFGLGPPGERTCFLCVCRYLSQQRQIKP